MILTLQTIPSTLISELFCISEYDGIVLDTEHCCFNNETLYACIQIIKSNNKKCFVRFTDLNKQLVRLCLDAGIDGAIFSTVETQKQAKEIAQYCTYPIHGGNRGCGLVRENNWGKTELAVNKPLIIAQLETKTSVDNIDDLINCNFDYYIIGPFDLSSSLGCVAEWNNLIFQNTLKIIYDKISKNKLGLFLPTIKNIEKYKLENKNLQIIIVGMDTEFIKIGIDTVRRIII